MQANAITVRRSLPQDLAALDTMMARSYPRLLKHDYPPSVLVLAVPLIARAQPALLGSGRYFVAEDAVGRIVGAGGWSPGRPRDAAHGGALGHVRHFATDYGAVRRGIGRALMNAVLQDAAAEGLSRLACMSTRTAVPFYQAMGFDALGPVTVTLGPGVDFPAVSMSRQL